MLRSLRFYSILSKRNILDLEILKASSLETCSTIFQKYGKPSSTAYSMMISFQTDVNNAKSLFQEYLREEGEKSSKVFDAFGRILVKNGDLAAGLKLLVQVQKEFGFVCTIDQLNLVMKELVENGMDEDCLELYDMIKESDNFPNINSDSDGYMLSSLSRLDFAKAKQLFNPLGVYTNSIAGFGKSCIANGEIDLGTRVFELFANSNEELFMEISKVSKNIDWFMKHARVLLNSNGERRNEIKLSIQEAFAEIVKNSSDFKKMLDMAIALEITPKNDTCQLLLNMWDGVVTGLGKKELRLIRIISWSVPERNTVWKKVAAELLLLGELPDSGAFIRLKSALNLPKESENALLRAWEASVLIPVVYYGYQKSANSPDHRLYSPDVLVELLDLAKRDLSQKSETLKPSLLSLIFYALRTHSPNHKQLDDIHTVVTELVNIGPLITPKPEICRNFWTFCVKFKVLNAAVDYLCNDNLRSCFVPPWEAVESLQRSLHEKKDIKSLKKYLQLRLQNPHFVLGKEDWNVFSPEETFEVMRKGLTDKRKLRATDFRHAVEVFSLNKRIDLVEGLWDITLPVLQKKEHFGKLSWFREQVYDSFLSVPSRAACEAIVEVYEDFHFFAKGTKAHLKWAEENGYKDLAKTIQELSTGNSSSAQSAPDSKAERKETKIESKSQEIDPSKRLFALAKQNQHQEFFKAFDNYVDEGGADPVLYNLAITTLSRAKNVEAVKVVYKEMSKKNMLLSEDALTDMLELLATVPNSKGLVARLAISYEFNERQVIAWIRSAAIDADIMIISGILESLNSSGKATSAHFAAAIQAAIDMGNLSAAEVLIQKRLQASNVKWEADLYRTVLKFHQMKSDYAEAIRLFDQQIDADAVDTGSLEIMNEIAKVTDDKLLLNAIVSIQAKVNAGSAKEAVILSA